MVITIKQFNKILLKSITYENISYKKAEIAEEIKFDLLLPQLSLHLLKEGTKYPDFSNNQDNCDFPFTYPG